MIKCELIGFLNGKRRYICYHEDNLTVESEDSNNRDKFTKLFENSLDLDSSTGRYVVKLDSKHNVIYNIADSTEIYTEIKSGKYKGYVINTQGKAKEITPRGLAKLKRDGKLNGYIVEIKENIADSKELKNINIEAKSNFVIEALTKMSIWDKLTFTTDDLKNVRPKILKMLESNMNCSKYKAITEIEINNKTYKFISETDTNAKTHRLTKVWQSGCLADFNIVDIYNKYKAFREFRYR